MSQLNYPMFEGEHSLLCFDGTSSFHEYLLNVQFKNILKNKNNGPDMTSGWGWMLDGPKS